MSDGLYSGVAAMNAAERRLDAIASNLANLSATGFKRRGTAVESFDALLREKTTLQVRARGTIDFSQGALRATGEPLDLALAGRGFFAVEGPAGEMFTRDGRFHVDQAGVLQTAGGHAVAWEGARGMIDASGPEVAIDGEGNVRQQGALVGRLRIVDFAASERLSGDGGGFFHAPRGLAAAPAAAEVRQGHLEQANASAVDEMVALIAVQRSFESATRLMSMIDQTYQRLTSSAARN